MIETNEQGTLYQQIITRIDTTSNWSTFNPIPKNNEQCIEDCGNGLFKLKIGDGVTPWLALHYYTESNNSFLRYKGSAVESELPTIGNIKGDMYTITDFDISKPGHKGFVIWNGHQWMKYIDNYYEPDNTSIIVNEDNTLSVYIVDGGTF